MLKVIRNEDKSISFFNKEKSIYFDLIPIYSEEDTKEILAEYFINLDFLIKKIGLDNFKNLKYSYLSLKSNNSIIDPVFFDQFKYNCPFNNYEHCSVVPVGIISNNLESYLRFPEVQKHNIDKEFISSWLFCGFPNGKNDLLEYFNNISRIKSIRLGAGYTEVCYPSDGCSNSHMGALKLENGDFLVCHFLTWSNK